MLETRNLHLFGSEGAEVRIGEGDAANTFTGLIPFEKNSVDLGGFVERIMPSAFTSTVTSGADIRALVDHNGEKLLARSSNKTLRVAVTPAGLAIQIDIPDTSYARDLRELVRRRDVTGLSFGFKTRSGGQRFLKENGTVVRELLDVDVREISVVSLPAYPDTSVHVRSAHIDPEVLATLTRPNATRCTTLLRHAMATA